MRRGWERMESCIKTGDGAGAEVDSTMGLLVYNSVLAIPVFICLIFASAQVKFWKVKSERELDKGYIRRESSLQCDEVDTKWPPSRYSMQVATGRPSTTDCVFMFPRSEHNPKNKQDCSPSKNKKGDTPSRPKSATRAENFDCGLGPSRESWESKRLHYMSYVGWSFTRLLMDDRLHVLSSFSFTLWPCFVAYFRQCVGNYFPEPVMCGAAGGSAGLGTRFLRNPRNRRLHHTWDTCTGDSDGSGEYTPTCCRKYATKEVKTV